MYGDAVDGVRPVKNDDLRSRLSACFEKISHHGLVGVEANAGILQIDEYRIQTAHLLRLWMALRIAIAEEADDGQAGLKVAAVSDREMLSTVDMRCIQNPAQAMLRAEHRGHR